MPAANDGGQRMDSSRYWNTIRSPKDWQHTRDVWDLGRMRTVDHVPGQYHYAMGDATNAYSREKMKKFTREIVFAPAEKFLFVFDHVVSTDASFHKAWLLHGVNQPSVDQDVGQGTAESKTFENANAFRFQEGKGELLVHSLLPRERVVIRRGGPGQDFYTPGDDQGGAWGSGENWPLEPAEGGPLPRTQNSCACGRHSRVRISPRSRLRIGRTSFQENGASRSHHRCLPKKTFFCMFLRWEMWGQQERSGRADEGSNFAGAAIEQGPCVVFAKSESTTQGGEVSIPAIHCSSFMACGLQPNDVYSVQFYGPNVASSPASALPGVEVDRGDALKEAASGALRLNKPIAGDLRVHIGRLQAIGLTQRRKKQLFFCRDIFAVRNDTLGASEQLDNDGNVAACLSKYALGIARGKTWRGLSR